MKSQGKREFRPFIGKRSAEEVGRIQQVIEEVAGLARPRVGAVELVNGNPRPNKWHIGRLRMVVACRLYDLGFRPGEITKLFQQDHTTTTNQLRSVHRLRENPRYAQFFKPLSPALIASSPCPPNLTSGSSMTCALAQAPPLPSPRA